MLLSSIYSQFDQFLGTSINTASSAAPQIFYALEDARIEPGPVRVYIDSESSYNILTTFH